MGVAKANYPTDVRLANAEFTLGMLPQFSCNCSSLAQGPRSPVQFLEVSGGFQHLDLMQMLEAKLCAEGSRS